jgi:hypothetical protein
LSSIEDSAPLALLQAMPAHKTRVRQGDGIRIAGMSMGSAEAEAWMTACSMAGEPEAAVKNVLRLEC